MKTYLLRQTLNTEEVCEACEDQGYLAVCIGMEENKKNDIWENQWCQNCIIISPDFLPPLLN